MNLASCVFAAGASGMSMAQSLAFFVSLALLWSFFQNRQICVQCGGNGAHRRDCPLKKDREEQDEER
ncbi:MAG: hypothetical protein QOE13_1391 [Gaiellaceae bacterium]|jgi:hypothetical protein|nr:hypothetical protein [Gaiellaceae bacterium]